MERLHCENARRGPTDDSGHQPADVDKEHRLRRSGVPALLADLQLLTEDGYRQIRQPTREVAELTTARAREFLPGLPAAGRRGRAVVASPAAERGADPGALGRPAAAAAAGAGSRGARHGPIEAGPGDRAGAGGIDRARWTATMVGMTDSHVAV